MFDFASFVVLPYLIKLEELIRKEQVERTLHYQSIVEYDKAKGIFPMELKDLDSPLWKGDNVTPRYDPNVVITFSGQVIKIRV